MSAIAATHELAFWSQPGPDNRFSAGARCTCGWVASKTSEADARRAGAAHLDETGSQPAPSAGEALKVLHQATRQPDPSYVAKLAKTWTDRTTGERRTMELDYVGHADLTDMLCGHDPLWSWEPMAYDENGLPRLVVDNGHPVGLWIRLTIHGHSRPGYGSCERGKHDAVKELIGDALRNAAMRFGVAVSLWSKAEWAEAADNNPPAPPAKPAGRTGKAKKTPAQLLGEAAKAAGCTDQDSRRDVLEAVTGSRSVDDLAAAQVGETLDAFAAIAAGRVELAYDENGTPYLQPAGTRGTT